MENILTALSINSIFPDKLAKNGDAPGVTKCLAIVLCTGLSRAINFYSIVSSLSHFSYYLTQTVNPPNSSIAKSVWEALFLDAVAKLRKATISFFMSVPPST
jgi:hypothetical protein